MPASSPISIRLADLTRRDPDGCWRFIGELRYGYGYIRERSVGRRGEKEGRGRMRRAHIVAYEIAYGPVPDGLAVMHSCDVRNCVNPAHLSVGTAAENNRQIVERGRHGNQWRKQLDDGGRLPSGVTL